MSSVWVDLMGSEVKFYQGKYRTRVIEAGTGETLILIHGTGGHAEVWSRNIMRLAQDFHVMAIDMLWHGYSQKDGYQPNQIATFADQVVDLLDQAGVEKAYVEGESRGGWVTQWLALHHTDRVHKVVLNTAAGVRFSPGTVKVDEEGGRNALARLSTAALSNPTREAMRKRLEWLVATPDRVTEEMVDIRLKIYSMPETQAALGQMFNTAFGDSQPVEEGITEDMLRGFKVPSLVFWSDKNPGLGPDAGQRMADLIPGAQLYVMKDAAHWPQWEHPEEHDGVVREFFLSPVPAVR